MKRTTVLAMATVLAGQTALAGGLDRTGQPIDIIFENGNYFEFSLASTSPSISGTDLLANPISNVASNFLSLGGGIKIDVTEAFSFSVIAESPYGSDVSYGGAPGTTLLGGTAAVADSLSITAVGRYKFSDRFSVHAGVRQQTISGDITLSGLAYGGLSGYNVALGSSSAVGFVAGAAYEIPDIAARVALTYNSEITHNLPTTETLGGFPLGVSADTEVKSPASINLDFQTGINPKTLIFGSVRYAMWSDLIISPTFFDALVDPGTPNSSISELDDTISYEVGVARRFTEKFAGILTLGYEPGGDDDLVSPLAPTNGNWSIGLGGRFTEGPVTISGGVRYTHLGDAMPETGTPDTARANFTDNDAVSLGFKIGVNF